MYKVATNGQYMQCPRFLQNHEVFIIVHIIIGKLTQYRFVKLHLWQ